MARVRIIGGAWRRRLIEVGNAPGLRPTPDAVRETLFNWLGQDLHGLACLDLFAGTGVLGLEAASRSATQVTLVERNARVFANLADTVHKLGTPPSGNAVELVRADALEFLVAAQRKYDVVFVDPPYHQGWLERLAPLLPKVLAPDAWVYAEAEHAVDTLAGLRKIKCGRAGQVYYQLLEASKA